MGKLRGVLVALAAGITTSGPLAAQSAPFQSIVEDLREREYRDIRGKLLAAAELMPAELYGYRAAPEIRSFGEEVAHAAAINARLCTLASGRRFLDPGNPPSPAPPAKPDLIARLRESLVQCDSVLQTLTDATARDATTGRYIRSSHVVAMLGHCWNVYGKLTLMMRLNQLRPR